MNPLRAVAFGFLMLANAWPAFGQNNATDIENIKRMESRWEEAWNKHDMKALASLVAEDVDFISVAGN